MNIEKKVTVQIGSLTIPPFLVNEYDGGKYWADLSGDYKEWLSKKLKGFEKEYIVISYDPISQPSGCIELVVEAIRKSDFDALEKGTICPECGWGRVLGQKNPDDVALHLCDSHGWDNGVVLAWLRDKVEEEAFGKEA